MDLSIERLAWVVDDKKGKWEVVGERFNSRGKGYAKFN